MAFYVLFEVIYLRVLPDVLFFYIFVTKNYAHSFVTSPEIPIQDFHPIIDVRVQPKYCWSSFSDHFNGMHHITVS